MPFSLAVPPSSEQHSPVQSAPLLDEVRVYSWAGMPWKMSLWSWYLPGKMSLSSQCLAQDKLPTLWDTHQLLTAFTTCGCCWCQEQLNPPLHLQSRSDPRELNKISGPESMHQLKQNNSQIQREKHKQRESRRQRDKSWLGDQCRKALPKVWGLMRSELRWDLAEIEAVKNSREEQNMQTVRGENIWKRRLEGKQVEGCKFWLVCTNTTATTLQDVVWHGKSQTAPEDPCRKQSCSAALGGQKWWWCWQWALLLSCCSKAVFWPKSWRQFFRGVWWGGCLFVCFDFSFYYCCCFEGVWVGFFVVFFKRWSLDGFCSGSSCPKFPGLSKHPRICWEWP